MFNGEKDIEHTGTYLTITPHEKLAFTWQSAFSLDDSTVTIDLKQLDQGKTEMTLTQVKFRNEGARDGHIKGWTLILDQLSALEEQFALAS
jgi:uncharacterized protein YndB with AHSA1/START domain